MPRQEKSNSDKFEASEINTDMTVSDFLGRVLMAALDNETYEVRSTFSYGGNHVDFIMKVLEVRPAVDLKSLQNSKN